MFRSIRTKYAKYKAYASKTIVKILFGAPQGPKIVLQTALWRPKTHKNLTKKLPEALRESQMAPSWTKVLSGPPNDGQWAPPSTSLDGPQPCRNPRKRCFRYEKKNWAAFPPVANRILVFFCRQWKKLFSLLRNLPGRFPTLSKPCKNVVPI